MPLRCVCEPRREPALVRAADVDFMCFKGSTTEKGSACPTGAHSLGGTDRCTLNPRERTALIEMYFSFNGASSTLGWPVADATSDPCKDSWLGVSCFSAREKGMFVGCVTRRCRVSRWCLMSSLQRSRASRVPRVDSCSSLRLFGRGLDGSIAASVSDLRELAFLYLFDNRLLTGTLPVLPTTLYHLNAKSCGFTGSVPSPSSFGLLRNLG